MNLPLWLQYLVFWYFFMFKIRTIYFLNLNKKKKKKECNGNFVFFFLSFYFVLFFHIFFYFFIFDHLNVKWKGTNIQLLDLPGIIEGASYGKGRGRQVIATAKSSDLILMVLDASKWEIQRELLEIELYACGIRLNKKPPNISFTPKSSGFFLSFTHPFLFFCPLLILFIFNTLTYLIPLII